MSSILPDVPALAAAAKADKRLMAPLWLAVERLVRSWALRYMTRDGSRLYDTEDLIQSGYLALCDAVAAYAPERGSFLSLLHYHARRRFREVLGIHSAKERPERRAVSLDEPAGGEGDATRAELLADPTAEFEGGLIEREAARRSAAAILAEADKLPEDERRALLRTAWEGLTLKAAAARENTTPERIRQDREKALRHIRASRTGRLLAREWAPPFRHVSFAEWESTHTSAVEWALGL